MKLKNILIVVNDMERSKAFYKELFGLDVILDGNEKVMLTEGLVLQERTVWAQALERTILPKNHATEIYFEEKDIDSFIKKLNNFVPSIEYVTTLTEHPWGQKIIRFYDPDGNLIEVGTPV